MTHPLFPSVEVLLSPETLSALAHQPVGEVLCQPLISDYAKSGSMLQIIRTNGGAGPRFVLKQINPSTDWLMRATDDRACRSIRLWQTGIFDRMPPEIHHGIVACAQDGDGWALLMQDLSSNLVPYIPFSMAELDLTLDAMAALHATFFEAPELFDPDLGLCRLPHVYGMFSPRTGQREAGGPDEIPRRILEGWDLVRSTVAQDVFTRLDALLNDPQPLTDALGRHPQTLIHGDWRHANQGFIHGETIQVVLLDWQLAAVAPPAVELARFLGTNTALLPASMEEAIALYREKLARRLGTRFSEEWWAPQLHLGLLGGFLQDGWAIVLKATHWHIGEGARDRWQELIEWWSNRVRDGLAWL